MRNKDTNQRAVAILKGDGAQVFAESLQQTAANQVEGALAPTGPVWPTAMQAWLSP